MEKERLIIITGFILVISVMVSVLIFLLGYAGTGRVIGVCEEGYSLSDEGVCCQDLNSDGECDPQKILITVKSSGLKTKLLGDERQEFKFYKVCNEDEFSGEVETPLGEKIVLSPGECHEFEYGPEKSIERFILKVRPLVQDNFLNEKL